MRDKVPSSYVGARAAQLGVVFGRLKNWRGAKNAEELNSAGCWNDGRGNYRYLYAKLSRCFERHDLLGYGRDSIGVRGNWSKS